MRQDFPQMDFKIPKIKPGLIRIAVLAVFGIILLYGAVYQISPEEIGVILRFGKFVRTADPGLNFKMPLGIETLTRVPVQRQLKLEFGFRTSRPGIRSEFSVTSETTKESMMLTGDLNVVDVEWIVQYKIKDAYKYLFKLRNVEGTFRSMGEAVVRKAIGDNSVDEVITVGRSRIADEAKQELQTLCDIYEIGIDVLQLIFQDVNPPDPVKPSFNEVNEALQEKETKINQAWAEFNQEIPKAEGEAEQVIRAAEGYATERVNRAQGDANLFTSVFREYSKAPSVTRKRLFLETINDVLTKIKKKIVVDEKLRSVLPLLNLGEEVKK
ncbi:MAG: FtsH protease activity modulator HflK [Candidatus Aminicenantales bacterium]